MVSIAKFFHCRPGSAVPVEQPEFLSVQHQIGVRRIGAEQRSALPEHVDVHALRGGRAERPTGCRAASTRRVREIARRIDFDAVDPAHVPAIAGRRRCKRSRPTITIASPCWI